MRLSTLWRPLAALALLAAFSLPAASQTPLLVEGFPVAVPPPGWNAFKTGVGTGSDWAPNSATARSQFSATGSGEVVTYLSTPPLGIPAGGARVTFKAWQSFGTVYNSQYRILISTTSLTDPAQFTVVSAWTETTACPGGAVMPASAPATRNCSLALPAIYNGQTVSIAFQHQNNNGDNFNLDDVLIESIPTAAVYTQTPTATQTLGTAGACTGTTSLTSLFTLSNTGVGTLAITGATVTGSGFTVDTSGLPASLTAGQAVTVPVTFTPSAGQTGPVAGTVAFDYTDGTAQTSAPVTINATATDASPNGGSGAGLSFANTATGTCAPSGTPPLGTAFVPVTAHTRVVTLAGTFDDGVFTVPVGALGTRLRAFGINHTAVYMNTNGGLMLGVAATDFSATLPTTTGGEQISVAKADYDFRNSNTDAAGVAGTPGLFYGLSDVDGNGTQDLVLTWWHAYDFGNTAATASPAYITAQMIAFRSVNPNQDDTIEIRFPGGSDANGVPFQLNTNNGPSGLVQDMIVGMSPSTSAPGEAAVYRQDGAGGPFAPESGVAVRFTPQTQATTASGAGWRLMSAPVNQFSVGRLADLNLVQSVTGQYPTFPTDNVLTGLDNATGVYTSPTGVTTTIDRGKGFFWYLFDLNLTPDPAGSGGGSSRSYALPMALQATGASPNTTANVPLSTVGDDRDNVFTMAGNPFRTGLDVSPASVGTWATGGTNALASNVVQYFDTATGTFLAALLAPTPNVLSAWTGFMVENAPTAGRTTLAIPASAQAAGGSFPGRTAEGAGLVAFELAGTTADGQPTLDRAATLVFDADATPTWDVLDASKLTPPLAAYATLGFQGAGILGAETVNAQESRPLAGEAFDVPLVVDAVGTAPPLTLAWPTLTGVPETVTLELRDLVTGTVVDLRAQTSYTFDVTAAPALDGAPETLVARMTTAAQAKAGTAPRFVLHVAPRGATAGEGTAVTAFALAAPSPNPTAGTATVSFDVPSASDVSVSVYDLLGRRVAILADGQVAAGRHTSRLDAGALAPGVYVVRMTAAGGGGSGTFAATQRVTVVR